MISIIVSTFGSSNKNLTELKDQVSNDLDFVIIHQKPENEAKAQLKSIYGDSYHEYDEVGLSKSRNLGISKATSEISLIADDDVVYIDGFEDKIKSAFEKNSEADIIAFMILTPEGHPYKKYSDKPFWFDKTKIFKVSSIEMAFRTHRVKEANLTFDEDFGLGTGFPLGEESIFISDALSKGLKILFVPFEIVYHPLESSAKPFTKKNLQARGAQLKRIYKGASFIFIILFYVRIMMKARSLAPLRYLVQLLQGARKYAQKRR